MVTLTELNYGDARAILAPALGGGIARLDVGGRPVLRPWDGDENNPFSLASNVLVPFSNRISGGGFEWAGERYVLEPNHGSEALPIHGDGFQRAWSIGQNGASARMELPDGAIGPWRYRALQVVQLSASGIEIELIVTNTGPHALPFGGGFHPWFPRTPRTRISFDAKKVWMEDIQHLPTKELALSDAPEWDFNISRPLPTTPINNAFTGWRGAARIHQGDGAVSCMMTASENLNTAIVYSPDGSADFFCFEPVSHPVDAVHLPGHTGLKELAPRQSLRAKMTISWRFE